MIYGWLSFRSLIKKRKHEKARSQHWSKRNLLAISSAYNLPKKRITTVWAHNMQAGGVPRMRISCVTSQGRKIRYRNTIKPPIRPLLRAFHKLAFFGFPVPILQNKCCMRVPVPKKYPEKQMSADFGTQPTSKIMILIWNKQMWWFQLASYIIQTNKT